MQAADRSVTVDLMVRSLLAIGAILVRSRIDQARGDASGSVATILAPFDILRNRFRFRQLTPNSKHDYRAMLDDCTWAKEWGSTESIDGSRVITVTAQSRSGQIATERSTCTAISKADTKCQLVTSSTMRTL